MSEYATDAEVLEAIDQGRKEALAKKATQEIMASQSQPQGDGGHPPLKSGEHFIPDPPSDTIIESLYAAMQKIQARLGGASTQQDRDNFDAYIRETMLEHGVVVDVKWFETTIPNMYMPEVEPYAVTDKHGRSIPGHPDYDPDEQVFNVVNDMLGTGQSGIIKGTGSKLISP